MTAACFEKEQKSSTDGAKYVMKMGATFASLTTNKGRFGCSDYEVILHAPVPLPPEMEQWTQSNSC